MLYLLDANVLIDANRDYYPLARVPEFWDWLVDCGVKRRMRIPLEMYEEVLAGRDDDLTRWLKDNRDALRLDEDVDEALVARVTVTGYAPDLSEVSRPKKLRANRHIPDVCRDLDVRCCNTFEFIKALNFTTGWQR